MMLHILSIQKSLIGWKENLLIPGRRFIKSGRVQKISRRTHQPRQMFLFSDILIYASPSIIDDHYHFHRLIQLENIRIDSSPIDDCNFLLN